MQAEQSILKVVTKKISIGIQTSSDKAHIRIQDRQNRPDIKANNTGKLRSINTEESTSKLATGVKQISKLGTDRNGRRCREIFSGCKV